MATESWAPAKTASFCASRSLFSAVTPSRSTSLMGPFLGSGRGLVDVGFLCYGFAAFLTSRELERRCGHGGVAGYLRYSTFDLRTCILGKLFLIPWRSCVDASSKTRRGACPTS